MQVLPITLFSFIFQQLFAFEFKEDFGINGWTVYDAEAELKRQVCCNFTVVGNLTGLNICNQYSQVLGVLQENFFHLHQQFMHDIYL